MATRYSGNAVVHLQWSDQEQGYEVSISVAGKQLWHDILAAPADLERAVDSPEAYDEVACSALAFLEAEAEEERASPDVHPAYNHSGRVEVARSKECISIEQPNR